jgi:hypothetical protein
VKEREHNARQEGEVMEWRKLYLEPATLRAGFNLRCTAEEKAFVAAEAALRSTSMNDLTLYFVRTYAKDAKGCAAIIWPDGACNDRLTLTLTREERMTLWKRSRAEQRTPSWIIRQAIRVAMAQKEAQAL